MNTTALRRTRRLLLVCSCILVYVTGEGCENRPAPAGITLTLIDQSWVDTVSRQRLSEQLSTFTSETGIPVEILPAPEAAVEQLATWRKLLESGAPVPDVYAVDVIWPGVLADELLDLNAYIPAQEIEQHFPELIANATVNGRLVALPFDLDAGFLLYRVDLLRLYGYHAPPKTWEELEGMAARIQAGERAKGREDFWGFVWQGALSEALTCNALEWQVSEGGGRIIENGNVTVNNPQTVRAWERAARWVGSISPPGVVSYKEWDAFNVWQAGQAAFMRNWSNAYTVSRARGLLASDSFDVAPLPAGRAGIAATLGGNGYGVSRHSTHPREAATLVRFLCRRDVQLNRCLQTAAPPTIPELYGVPEVQSANPYYSRFLELRSSVVSRPSAASGKRYAEVSRAYSEAVHEVLTGTRTAAEAAARLQDELVRITGSRAATAAGNSTALRDTAAGNGE
jgi:trehalose/maltose transport system substrate-binding protein